MIFKELNNKTSYKDLNDNFEGISYFKTEKTFGKYNKIHMMF